MGSWLPYPSCVFPCPGAYKIPTSTGPWQGVGSFYSGEKYGAN